jgi:hypothetical protein
MEGEEMKPDFSSRPNTWGRFKLVLWEGFAWLIAILLLVVVGIAFAALITGLGMLFTRFIH